MFDSDNTLLTSLMLRSENHADPAAPQDKRPNPGRLVRTANRIRQFKKIPEDPFNLHYKVCLTFSIYDTRIKKWSWLSYHLNISPTIVVKHGNPWPSRTGILTSKPWGSNRRWLIHYSYRQLQLFVNVKIWLVHGRNVQIQSLDM